jgi:alkylation response protein AidB-like acyl-CoA dehydrogenase
VATIETLSETEWLERTREVGRKLAADVVARDRANQQPVAEIALLKESGLVTMLGPVEHGGGGQSLTTAYRVTRELAKYDASVAMLLGYSFIWSVMPKLVATPEQQARLAERATREQWFWGGVANPRDPDLSVADAGDHLVFNGRKNFSTGGSVADVVLLAGMDPAGTDTPMMVLVPARSEGLRPLMNWDALGVRLSDSGGMEVVDVRAEWENVFGYVDKVAQTRLSNIFGVPVFQLLFTNLYLGIGQGALDTAAEWTRTKTRPPQQSEHERSVDDPYVLSTYGDLAADLLAAEALVERAGAEVQEAFDDLDALTERRRGEIAVLVSAAKVIATRVSIEVTSRIFDVTGARATSSSVGLDRFWRDIRTHSLHDSIAYKVREIGIFFLRDEIPDPTWYT